MCSRLERVCSAQRGPPRPAVETQSTSPAGLSGGRGSDDDEDLQWINAIDWED